MRGCGDRVEHPCPLEPDALVEEGANGQAIASLRHTSVQRNTTVKQAAEATKSRRRNTDSRGVRATRSSRAGALPSLIKPDTKFNVRVPSITLRRRPPATHSDRPLVDRHAQIG